MTYRPQTRQQQSADRLLLEMAARQTLLMIHGLLGFMVGVIILVTGAPDFIEGWFSPWSRVVLAALAIIPGILVLSGVALSERHRCGWWGLLLGLLGLLAWYGSMGVAYAVHAALRGLQAASIGQPLDPGMTGRGYVPFIYLALVMAISVHILVVVRLGRPSR